MVGTPCNSPGLYMSMVSPVATAPVVAIVKVTVLVAVLISATRVPGAIFVPNT